MPATSGFAAGVEANDLETSYGLEAVWGTPPATAFQAVRITSETLTSTRKRDRPAELNTTGEVSAAVTTQISAGGNVSFSLSAGTFDDWLAGGLFNDWTAKTTITAIAGDISATATVAGVSTVTSTLAGKFSAVAVGDWVKLAGFTHPTNNGVFKVSAATGTALTVNNTAAVVEAGTGTAITVTKASKVTNGTSLRSLFIQKKFAPALFLTYPGSVITDMTISGGTAQFLNGTFSVVSKNEASAIVSASTGSVLPAPTGRVMDPVAGFLGIFWNGVELTTTVDSFSLQATRNGAALEFGMGAAAAAGVLKGALECKGTLKLYFNDFSTYSLFAAETAGTLEIVASDAAGSALVLAVPVCNLMNPTINAGSQNTAVMASFTIEGNPQPGGGTVSFSRL
jgi:hypothetical protein